ncbi:hypothetical protein [Amaricoccus macauensis]|uniref:hypothetical protein n=1 Tax=Amaricoccus macauensis TaxID=57001 RepID=UPI003C7D9912
MKTTRRTVFKLLLASAASLSLPLPFAGRVPPVKATPGFHMVNGWILTDADVEALRKLEA